MDTERLGRLTRSCFVAVAVLALAVLASWGLNLGDLSLGGRASQSMAPTTAVLFLVVALMSWWHQSSSTIAVARWATIALGLVVSAYALVFMLTMPWAAAATIPRGSIVPITAMVFLLMGLDLIVGGLPSRSTVKQHLHATLGMLVLFAGVVVWFSYGLGVPFVFGQPLPALSTGTGFFILGAGLVLSVVARSWPALVFFPSGPDGSRRARTQAWVAAAAFVVLAVLALALIAVRATYHPEREAAYALAGAAAESEAQQISTWFLERQADAEFLRESPLIADELVRLVGEGATARQRADVEIWLGTLVRPSHFDRVILIDSVGRVLLTEPAAATAPPDPRTVAAVPNAVRTGAVQFVDMGWVSDTELSPVWWVVPVAGASAKVVLILTADLGSPIRSALEAWYASNATAEAMVVGRSGDGAFFFNQPRLGSTTSPRRFVASEAMPLPVKMAAGRQEGNVATLDYRGVPVFAAVRQIAGTPLAVIVKMDQAEFVAAANETTLIVGASFSAAVFAAMLAIGLLWYRRELKTTQYIAGLSTIVAQAPVSIVITDLAGTISYVNPMFTQVTGYTSAEVIGHNPRILKSGELSADDYRQMWDTIQAGQVWNGELHNKRKNGELFWEIAIIAPLRDATGHPYGFVALKREITAEKVALEAHATLESAFAQAQKMESVGRLAGGVAHDFNNMLAVILGHAELALEGLDDASPQREHLVEILQAGQRSSDLTRQLLAFARKQKANPKVLDLNEGITNTLKMLKRLIGENIALVWKPDAGLWRVFMDPAQVDQILANLSVNARDAITGPGTLTIETANVTVSIEQARDRPQLRPGQFVRLLVRDSGCGMPPEVLAHLFEPFFTTKAEGKGTGLGTATVYGIVTQNEGAIEVQSAVGEGTTIWIYLPRTLQDEAAASDVSTADLPRGSETILVVEDESTLLLTYTRLLERLGYTVVGCRSAAHALAVVEDYAGTIDALLTDVVMPGMSGRELADVVVQRRAGIRVVFMSGYTADIIFQQGVLEDGVHFLTKPFSTAQLAAKMREVFQ